MNVYLDLTRVFNQGRTRAILSSGQAVVLHRLAIMSKDGDWILREDPEATQFVLNVLAGRNASYRFGAPLDVRWLRGGWSSHLEFQYDNLRVRTDFVTKPPRLSPDDLHRLWSESAGKDIPYPGAADLAEIKKTNREKDYAVIGELARLVTDVGRQVLLSRSARDILDLAAKHPQTVRDCVEERPLLAEAFNSREALEVALDAERRRLMRTNEERLNRYTNAAESWARIWPEVSRTIQGIPLPEAHAIMVSRAENVLPFELGGDHHA